MNTFVVIVIILLILSIINNFIMYNKCYILKSTKLYIRPESELVNESES